MGCQRSVRSEGWQPSVAGVIALRLLGASGILRGERAIRRQHMSVVEQQQVEGRPAEASLPSEGPVTPWRHQSDPFAGISPIVDLSMLTGGLPDARDADDILRDLAECRMKRAPVMLACRSVP